MLREWEDAPIGNTSGAISLLPRRTNAARVVVNLLRGRQAKRAARMELPSAA
jgi:hypothetical protein